MISRLIGFSDTKMYSEAEFMAGNDDYAIVNITSIVSLAILFIVAVVFLLSIVSFNKKKRVEKIISPTKKIINLLILIISIIILILSLGYILMGIMVFFDTI